MKSYFILGSLFCSVTAFAQKIDQTKVPAAVQTAFSKNFPHATNVKWEMEKANYEAGFKENSKHVSAVFDAGGKWLETETGIAAIALPKEATAYLAAHYKGAAIKETAKIQKADGDINYEAEVKGKDVIFDSKGTFLKEEKD